MEDDKKFETENKNELIADESVLNSNVKESITNRDLVELGFPEFITEKGGQGDRFVEEEVDFYNALYTLVKLYEKYTSKKLELRVVEHVEYLNRIYAVYLNKIKVLDGRVSGHVYIKYQNLDGIKKMVEELLVYFDNDFDALKREFVKQYAEEKAKIDFNAIEIYNRKIYEKLPYKKGVIYGKKMVKLVGLLETKYGGKELYYLNEPLFFGESYSIEPTGEKLKNRLHGRLDEIYLFKNLLVMGTMAIILDENEKQEILKWNNLYENFNSFFEDKLKEGE